MITPDFLKIMMLLLFFSAFACKKENKRGEAEKAVNEWLGREIKFPSDAQCCMLGKDTTSTLCNELLDREFKVLLYIDSTGCSDCRLRLQEWKQLITESDTLFNGKLGFLFFFQPKSTKEISYIFKTNDFSYPVFIDMNNSIDNLNLLSKSARYQCFLLNKDNRVILLGNPAQNPKIWELYKKIISREVSG
jgi:hypothetical protein